MRAVDGIAPSPGALAKVNPCVRPAWPASARRRRLFLSFKEVVPRADCRVRCDMAPVAMQVRPHSPASHHARMRGGRFD